MPVWITILSSCLGSVGLFSFVQFLITRHDKKKGQMAEIQKKLVKMERDSVRTQLLLLMSNYPDDRRQIMMLAEYYFVTLKSNWYLTGIFQSWLQRNDIPAPAWFREEHHNAD